MLIYLLLALLGASFIPGVREFLKPKMKWVSLVFGVLFTLVQVTLIFIMIPYLLAVQKDLNGASNPFVIPSQIAATVGSVLLILNCFWGHKILKGNILFYATFVLIFLTIIAITFEIISVLVGIYSLTNSLTSGFN